MGSEEGGWLVEKRWGGRGVRREGEERKREWRRKKNKNSIATTATLSASAVLGDFSVKVATTFGNNHPEVGDDILQFLQILGTVTQLTATRVTSNKLKNNNNSLCGGKG